MTGERMVESCWMCGIRVRVDQLVADGGSACPDVRWYCRDMRGCTQRWTLRLQRGELAVAPTTPSMTHRRIAG